MQPPPEKTSLPTLNLFPPEERLHFMDSGCCNHATKWILLRNEAQQVPMMGQGRYLVASYIIYALYSNIFQGRKKRRGIISTGDPTHLLDLLRNKMIRLVG